MILDKNVDIKINPSNYKHYNQYYSDIKCGDLINVTIEQLIPGTETKILVKCDICENKKLLSYNMYNKNIKKYQIYACSRKCSQFKIEKTSLEKYGTLNPSKSEIIKNKIKTTNNVKYNVDYTYQSNEIKEKIKITNNLKYGVDYPQQNKEIYKKSKETNLEKYGCDISSKNINVKKKISDKLKESWNNKIISNYNVISISGNTYELKCEYGHTYFIEKTLLNNRKYFNTKLCTICNKKNSGSGQQQNIEAYIKSIYNGEILINNRKILDNEYEIDIYLPDLKIGIEYNGLYWHSNKYLNEKYHYNKYFKSKEKNIQLIQIWEDDWKLNNVNIKNNIYNRIYNNVKFTDDIIIVNNMNPYDLKDYKIINILPPNKYFVKNKIRYNNIIDYDFIVYDAGCTIYKKIL